MAPVEKLLEQALSKAEGYEFGTFWFGVHAPEGAEADKGTVRKGLIEGFASRTGKKPKSEQPELLLMADLKRGAVSLEPEPVCIKGRYNKYERGIPQTVHYCYKCKGRGCRACSNTGRISDTSVEEMVAEKAVPLFEALQEKFHGMGREDADVRMLGRGRPFVLELIHPKKRSPELKQLELEINKSFGGRIEVRDLEFCTKDEIENVKESTHSKEYLAVVECEKEAGLGKLEQLLGKELTIQQRTPLRVSKRRADKVREHSAVLLTLKSTPPKSFELAVRGSAGLYIKELVSSDDNRTKPSIAGLLGVECTCKALDVLEVLD